MLTELQTFVWGVVGGGMAYVAAFVLPQLPALMEKGIGWPGWRILASYVVAAFVFTAMGGGVALWIGGATQYKHAIAYGLAWESLLKGGIHSAYTWATTPSYPQLRI